MKSPLLFLVFNRPDTTRQVFEAIRAARPPRLFIAADGPRSDRAGEAQRCAEVRAIASAVDWPCSIETLFRDRNLGCKMGVSSGISWFFERESEGVILEDDVLPVPTFFDYCDELLQRHRNDERVAMVSGCNFVTNHFTPRESYFFSRYSHIWGWASWRRAWRHYDVAMTAWPAWRDGGGLAKVSGGSRLFESYWRGVFDAAHQGMIDTWDYQWTFTCWRIGGLTALPKVNQTRNLGFGADATHTTGGAPAYIQACPPGALELPLLHPGVVERALEADALIDSKVFGINFMNALKRHVQRIPLYRSAASSVRSLKKNAVH
jgi:hypothetical protein